MNLFLMILKDNILYVYNFAVWLAGLMAMYIVLPDVYYGFVSSETIKFINALVITALVTALITMLKKRGTQAQKKKYLAGAIISLLAGVISLIYYLEVLDRHTVQYPPGSSNIVVIGTHYQDTVYREAETCQCHLTPDESQPEKVLESFIPEITEFDMIWPAREIRANSYRLIGISSLAYIFLSTFFILIGYAAIGMKERKKKIPKAVASLIVGLMMVPLYSYSNTPAGASQDCPSCREPDPLVPLERIIIEEISELNRLYKADVRVYIGRSINKAVKDVGIILNPAEIDAIRNNAQGNIERMLIRLILAHEYSHMLQYKIYHEKELALTLYNKMLLECEADIFAGVYLHRKLIQDSKDKLNQAFKVLGSDVEFEEAKKYFSDEVNAMHFAFSVFFDLSAKFDNSYHPTSEQRLAAVKTGNFYGSFLMRDTVRQFYLDLAKEQLPDQNLKDEEIMEMLKYAALNNMDFLPSDNYLIWSQRQARRILHFDQAVSRHIEFHELKTMYDKNPEHPAVYYSGKIKNPSAYAIKCDFTVSCYALNRDKPLDNKLSNVVSSKNYKVILQPNDSLTLNDSLFWHPSHFSYPVVLLPHDWRSLYSFQYANIADIEANNNPYIIHYNIKKNQLIDRLPSLMHDIAMDAGNDFYYIQATPSFIRNGTRSFNCFSPELPIRASFRENGGTTVNLVLANIDNKKQALELFHRIESLVRDFATYAGKSNAKKYFRYVVQPEKTKAKTKARSLIPIQLIENSPDHNWMLVYEQYTITDYKVTRKWDLKPYRKRMYEVRLRYIKAF